MKRPRRCIFNEFDSGSLIEVNPLAVRFIRRLDNGTEIVFSEAHSVKVRTAYRGVCNAFAERTPWSEDEEAAATEEDEDAVAPPAAGPEKARPRRGGARTT